MQKKVQEDLNLRSRSKQSCWRRSSTYFSSCLVTGGIMWSLRCSHSNSGRCWKGGWWMPRHGSRSHDSHSQWLLLCLAVPRQLLRVLRKSCVHRCCNSPKVPWPCQMWRGRRAGGRLQHGLKIKLPNRWRGSEACVAPSQKKEAGRMRLIITEPVCALMPLTFRLENVIFQQP